MPLLGVGRGYFKLQVVAPGRASARLHSHTTADEYYFVLSGRGTLRMLSHSVAVGPGMLIAKPTGSDLTSQLVADQGEALSVLDMELWPDSRMEMGTREVVEYSDHEELIMIGPGSRAMVPQKALTPLDGLSAHYFDGYVRERDGSFTAKEFPGHPARRPE